VGVSNSSAPKPSLTLSDQTLNLVAQAIADALWDDVVSKQVDSRRTAHKVNKHGGDSQ
jgi:hypothetical protein